MEWLDIVFWMTGLLFWIALLCVVVLAGLPNGEPYAGVTRITFYGFGPVFWRVTHQNRHTFVRLKECGYHFAPLCRGWHLGLSLPTWLSRRLAK